MSGRSSGSQRPSSLRAAAAVAAVVSAVWSVAAHAQDVPPAEPPAPAPPAPPAAPPQEKPPEPPPRAAFRGTPEELAAKHPAVVRLSDYGRSAGGRALRLVTVSPSKDEEVEWEALVVAHLSSYDPAEARPLALDVAARLAERAEDLPARTAFRFAVDASPDAGVAGGLPAGNATATDDDQDGDRDEDAPDDLDGDGQIGWMRVPDPAGDFGDEDAAKPDEGPRRADAAKGVAPKWKIVREGRDDDGDGRLNEDGAGGVDVARNFATFFEEHVPTSGRWAVSEPETRALMDLLLANERIALVYEIGRAETLAAAPEWTGVWPKLPDDDQKLLEALRAAHGKGAVEKRTGRAPAAGSLAATCWHQLGRLWVGRAPFARSAPPWPLVGADAVNWKFTWSAVEGPKVPAGAQVLHAAPVPDKKSDEDLARDAARETDSVADFLLLVANGRPKVAFTKTESSGEPGVLRLETRLVNEGRFPTHTQRGAEVRGRLPLNLRVRLPQAASLLAGRPLAQIERLAGGAETGPYRWVVSGPSGSTVRVECSGPDTATTALEVKIP